MINQLNPSISCFIFLLIIHCLTCLTLQHLQLTPSMAIYDTMQSLQTPVATHCIGRAYNLAAFILAGGEKVLYYHTVC